MTKADTGALNNFVTVPFTAIGFNTSDIQQIQITDPENVTFDNLGWGDETFSLWSGVPTVIKGSSAIFYHPDNDPEGKETEYYWGDAAGSRVEYSIAKGQAAAINCAAGLVITAAGEVPTEAVEFTSVDKNNFAGNPFPATIDIQNIVLSDPDDVTFGGFGWGDESFSVWEGLPTVVKGSGAIFYDPDNDPEGKQTGFYWGDAVGTPVKYDLPPFQGVVINCAAGLKIKIIPPFDVK